MKTLYFLSTLLFFYLFADSEAALDCNNTLLRTMNITGRLKNPVKVWDVPYCYNVQSQTTARSCCNPEYLKNIQLIQDGVIQRILEWNAKKDIYIKSNVHLIKQVNEAFKNLTELILKSTNTTLNDILRVRMAPIRTFFNALRADFEDLLNNFPDYQAKRAQCLRRMIMIQGGLYCLACDANYAARGVDKQGNVTFSSRLCTKIQVDCQPFIVAAKKTNRIAQMQRALTILQGLANITSDYNGFPRTFNMDKDGNRINYLPETQRDGNPPVTYLGWIMAKDGAPVVVMDFAPADISQRDTIPPPNCDDDQNATKCIFMCGLNSFPNMTLSNEIFGVGGIVQYNDGTVMDATIVRLLEEMVQVKQVPADTPEPQNTYDLDDWESSDRVLESRNLQLGGFDPDDGETGTLDNVIADPAGVGFSPLSISINWIGMLMIVGLFYIM